MHFYKMHGIGNDFIVLNLLNNYLRSAPEALAKQLCDRNFSIGADGLVLLVPSDRADFGMLIFNSDGSRAQMCGNALRCVSKLMYDAGLFKKDVLRVETTAGVKAIGVTAENGTAVLLEADMGVPYTETEKIPVLGESNILRLRMDEKPAAFFCVSMGNPHAVTFDIFPAAKDLERLGRQVENDRHFPEKTNVEFCRVEADGKLLVQVWERGAGATLACGTGACASVYAACRLGKSGRTADVVLPGGTLNIRLGEDGHIFMKGPAALSFEGEIDIV